MATVRYVSQVLCSGDLREFILFRAGCGTDS